MTPFGKARLLALIVPSALMLGALGSQYIGGLYPCEMCHWQRWPHDAAIVLALFAFAFKRPDVQRLCVALAALGILTSGLIGVFHAGVEYKWWEGFTQCTAPIVTGAGDFATQILNAPLVRCDEPQWTLLGISLAGYNAIISIASAIAIFGLLQRKAA